MMILPDVSLCKESAPASTDVASRVVVLDQLTPAPFWRSKPAVYEAMVSERRVVVSAKTQKADAGDYEMSVVAAGLVRASLATSWDIIQDFEKLPKVDSRFEEVKYDPAGKKLFVHAVAYGYHARMHMLLRFGESSLAREMHFEVVEGNFRGMTGVIRLEDDRRQKTEISMTSNYRSDNIPLPAVLMGFGLEIVGQQVASSMRTYIEEEAKKRN